MFQGIAIFSFEKSEDEKMEDELEAAKTKTYLEASSWFDSLSHKQKEYFFILSVGPT